MRKIILSLAAFLLLCGSAFATHPLITDDTSTQGRGKFQLELTGEYSRKEKDAIVETAEAAATLSAGVGNSIDIIVAVPYRSTKERDTGTASTDGVVDVPLQLKWRFYEKDGLSLALKPGITLPAGNDEKGRGTGRITYTMFFIATKEVDPAAFHLNLGYRRNENRIDERKDLYYASIAGEIRIKGDLRFTLDTGIETNPDKSSGVDPAFILGGFIYSLSKNVDFDVGVKSWWNNMDKDYSLLTGITWRF